MAAEPNIITDTLFFDCIHAISCHDSRVILPLIPKCMNTSLLAGWKDASSMVTLTDPAVPDARVQAVVHAPGTVPIITSEQSCRLLDSGYLVVAVIRDPMDRLISFYLNKGRYLINGENWDWIVKRPQVHPVRLPRWFKSGGGTSSRAFGQSLSIATFRQFIMELSIVFEAAGNVPKIWTQMNKHITPYSRVFKYLKCNDKQLVVFDMQKELSGLHRLLVSRGMNPSTVNCMIGTRANVNPKGAELIENADVMRLDALPCDMSYESLKAPDLVKIVNEMYKDDYDVMTLCTNS